MTISIAESVILIAALISVGGEFKLYMYVLNMTHQQAQQKYKQ